MKLIATALVIGTLVGAAALPARAQEAPEVPPPHEMGGGGGPGMRAMAGAHQHMNVSLRAYNNQANGNVYTMVGIERLRSSGDGWFGGFGWYQGFNLGMTPGVDAASHGGLILGKDFGHGPLTLGIGVLLGMGCDVVASPTLTFSDFAAYFVGEPRISLGWVMHPHAELKLSAGYLASTSMGQAAGPTAMLTLSAIKLGMGHAKGREMGPGMGPCPECGR